jgi:parvulin-like peptidyl-prolyl isomerase
VAAQRRIRRRSSSGEDPRRESVDEAGRGRRAKLIAAVAGVFVLVMAGILIGAYVFYFVLPPREVMVKVNDVVYTRGDLVKLVRVQQRGAEYLGIKMETATEVFNVLQNLVQNEILIQSAPRFGVTISEVELDQHIRELVLRRPSSDPEQAEREFKELYSGYLNAIQLSEDEHRDTIRRSMTRERLVQFMSESVPRVAEQVRVYRAVMLEGQEFDIMEEKYEFATEQATTPDDYIAAFREVVREFSRDDRDTVRKNGELGWVPRGILEDYDEVLFNLEVGQLSARQPDFDNPKVFFYFMIADKEEARDLSDEHWNELKSKALTRWVNERREEFDVFSALNSTIYDWVLLQLGFSAPPEVGTKLITPTLEVTVQS